MWYLKILIPLVVVIVIVVPIVVVFTRSDGDGDVYPTVNTTVGLIRGRDSEDGTHTMYLGIPYAVVDQRNPFGAATPNPIFEDVFDAFDDKTNCPQSASPAASFGSLDCLQLSVYVPKTEYRPLSVLIYIHGGRFMVGASGLNRFGPKFLVRHDVIYVSLHYRLSVYGFMCLHTPEVPGNQGLKDQLNALRWIKNNIAAFGGDVDNITVFGDSAGGVSTDLQLLYADDGLFHKVITQSGTSLAPWGIEEPDLDAAFKIARQMGHVTNDLNEALQFLSNQTAINVQGAVAQLSMRFTPCIERPFAGVQSFMTVHPVRTQITRARNIPYLAGYNDDEKLMTYGEMPAEMFDTLDIFNYNMRLGFQFADKHDEMKAFVRRFYARDAPMNAQLRRPVTDFESDFLFTHPTQRSLSKYLASNGTAYHYVFTYIGGRNMLRMRMNITQGGVSHADELGYLFDLPSITDTPSPADQLIIDRITTLWTNFAKYGEPTPAITDLLPVRWLPVTKDRLNYLNLTTAMDMRARPFHRRLAFWDFFYDTNKESVRGYAE